jgi:hypothetical protein
MAAAHPLRRGVTEHHVVGFGGHDRKTAETPLPEDG